MRFPEGRRFDRSRTAIRGAGVMMALSVSLLLADCRSEATAEEVPPQTTKSASTTAHPADAPLVVFLGDSLTAGYGLAADETFPSRVAALLEERGEADSGRECRRQRRHDRGRPRAPRLASAAEAGRARRLPRGERRSSRASYGDDRGPSHRDRRSRESRRRPDLAPRSEAPAELWRGVHGPVRGPLSRSRPQGGRSRWFRFSSTASPEIRRSTSPTAFTRTRGVRSCWRETSFPSSAD